VSENNIWNSFIPPTDMKVVPFTNMNIKYWTKGKAIFSNEEQIYSYKLMYAADIYSKFEISLYPNECISFIGLFIENYPVMELIQKSKNKFSFSKYFCINQFICYYLKLKIKND